uniref:Uncharacterized protein n=1 Tax=Arundo donax TaxID=35708 RepID=A0A0A9C523_ARUDO
MRSRCKRLLSTVAASHGPTNAPPQPLFVLIMCSAMWIGNSSFQDVCFKARRLGSLTIARWSWVSTTTSPPSLVSILSLIGQRWRGSMTQCRRPGPNWWRLHARSSGLLSSLAR